MVWKLKFLTERKSWQVVMTKLSWQRSIVTLTEPVCCLFSSRLFVILKSFQSVTSDLSLIQEIIFSIVIFFLPSVPFPILGFLLFTSWVSWIYPPTLLNTRFIKPPSFQSPVYPFQSFSNKIFIVRNTTEFG